MLMLHCMRSGRTAARLARISWLGGAPDSHLPAAKWKIRYAYTYALGFFVHEFINTRFVENMVVDYLRAAAGGATGGKNGTCYHGGAGRPDRKYMVVDYRRGPWPRACGAPYSISNEVRVKKPPTFISIANIGLRSLPTC